ncbi:hypothetical protein [Proteocatella sphenisci]|uniref:hypothetical protein n=1 Tax=Proteocatella sphenisci TaxID=181070 RepID=UPI00048DEEE3|nr:hypothetical protein [Proteocatella sphenisci]
MEIFNLENLNKWQEVPKIIYKPLNVTDANIYFEKIVLGMEDNWSEGIWEYDKLTHVMNRMDKGHHAENIQLYDMDTPVNYLRSDIEGARDNIYFVTITEEDDDDFMEFYEINLKSRLQKKILGFTFDRDSFLYKKMEILAPGYILFRLSYNMELADSDFFDSIYLLDVKEKKYYEILDDAFNINAGKRIITGKTFEDQYIFMEEYYLSEDEQFEVLVSAEVELAFDLPGDLEKNQVHINSIKYIKLSDFIDQVKSGAKHIGFEVIDEIDQEGIIRTIGHSDTSIYYRKEYYNFILNKKSDFVSRRKIGRSEIYKVNKETFKKTYVKDVDKSTSIIIDNNDIFEIIEFDDRSELLNMENHKSEYIFRKGRYENMTYEIVDFKNKEFLIIMVSNGLNGDWITYHVIDALTKKEISSGNDILTIDNCIFVI